MSNTYTALEWEGMIDSELHLGGGGALEIVYEQQQQWWQQKSEESTGWITR